eukprot:TRINITY_DN2361_c0_g1_i1.p1 TRINITY_DN2361_c0_g1~~TRINITY_DN2361_c0_g1_i1.p1  ORF type:complete len:820 (+),score=140.19 TRINITY_DN2361_c0_g1_i1:89-2548(+)
MSGNKANVFDLASLENTWKRSTKLEEATKDIMKTAVLWTTNGNAFAVETTNLSEGILKFTDSLEVNKDIVLNLKYFGKAMKVLATEIHHLMFKCTQQFLNPLTTFVEHEFVATGEAKKKVDKATLDYNAALTKGKGGISKGTRIDKNKLNDFTNELERLRENLDDRTADLAARLDEIDLKVEQKVLAYMWELMLPQFTYYERGYELLKAIKPRMELMKQHVSRLYNTMDPQKEGYLSIKGSRHKVKNGIAGMRSQWTNRWFVLRDGLFYSHKEGKIIDEQGVLDVLLCTVRAPDKKVEDRKRFEVLAAGKKKPMVLEAESEAERDEWLKAFQDAISFSLNTRSQPADSDFASEDFSFTGSHSHPNSPILSAVTPRNYLTPRDSINGSGKRKGSKDKISRGGTLRASSSGSLLISGSTVSPSKNSLTSELSVEETERYLKLLRTVPGNDLCADCGARDPDWVSINLGVVVCLGCSGVHRSLGTHISKIRSLRLDRLDLEILLMIKYVGNQAVNNFYEYALRHGSNNTITGNNSVNSSPGIFGGSAIISSSGSNSSGSGSVSRRGGSIIRRPEASECSTGASEDKSLFIKNKYVEKHYLKPSTKDITQLNKSLFSLTKQEPTDPRHLSNTLVKCIRLMALGADPNWPNPSQDDKTAVHQASVMDNVVLLELLLQNKGDLCAKDKRGWTPLHYACFYENENTVKLLLKRSSKKMPELLTNDGETPTQLFVLNYKESKEGSSSSISNSSKEEEGVEEEKGSGGGAGGSAILNLLSGGKCHGAGVTFEMVESGTWVPKSKGKRKMSGSMLKTSNDRLKHLSSSS